MNVDKIIVEAVKEHILTAGKEISSPKSESESNVPSATIGGYRDLPRAVPITIVKLSRYGRLLQRWRQQYSNFMLKVEMRRINLLIEILIWFSK